MRDKRRRYYFLGIPPLIFGMVFFLTIQRSWYELSLFFVGYCWNFTLLTPGLYGRVIAKKYRFSFVRFLYKLNVLLARAFYRGKKPFLKIALRLVIPFSILAFAIIVSGSALYVAGLVGLIYFEVILAIVQRIGRVRKFEVS